MITLKEWMELVDYRITEGSDYCWDCYGHDAHCLDSWNGDQNGHSFTVIFDTKTQVVYEVQAHDYLHNRAYRLINPDYVDAHRKEGEDRNIDNNQAWDDINYVDLEVDDDFIQKALAIVAGEDYDTRVSIPLDIPEDELLKFMIAAHERNMTFNEFVEKAIMSAIEDAKRDPEGFKQRAEKWKNEKSIL